MDAARTAAASSDPVRGRSAPPLDPLLLATAAEQHGVLTTGQCTLSGLSARALVRLVDSGILQHPGRGLYIVTRLAESEPEAKHRQLVAGALLLYPDAVLVGTTALLAHGVKVWGAPLEVPSLVRPIGRTGGMSAFWVRPARGQVVETEWGPATTVAEALVQHTIDRGILPGVVSADDALRTAKVGLSQLGTAGAVVRATRGGGRVGALIQLVDKRRESVGESRCGVALAIAGIDVEPQVDIRDERGRVFARVDFAVKDTMVVIEFDGKVKYASGEPGVLWDEKRREDRLRALGYVVVRITWADLERPGAVVAKVRAALRRHSGGTDRRWTDRRPIDQGTT
ncbi:MAG: type IV toxin-antitoxin system AbiEi family antitoxin domain-containing protein [Phycicoccus sp.]